MNKPIVRNFGHFDSAIDLACLEKGMLVDTTKTQSRLGTGKLDEKVAKLHIPRSAVHCTLKPDTGSDGVAFVTLAVSTMKRGVFRISPASRISGIC